MRQTYRSGTIVERFTELVRSERYRELSDLVTGELGTRSAAVDPWALTFILEFSSRLETESQLVRRHLAEAELRSGLVSTHRSYLLAFLQRLTSNGEWGAVDVPAEEATEVGVPQSTDVCQLTVRSFGRLEVEVDGVRVVGWNGNKSQLVLNVLLAQPHRRVSKDVLMETLWPDAAPSTSRRRLHQAVYTLRRAFAAVRPDIEFIIFERDHYLVNPDLKVYDDVAEFERLVAGCRSGGLDSDDGLAALAHRLLTLYQGEFLVDVPYEDWVIRHRERLRLAFESTAEQLADSLLSHDAADDAVVLMQRVLELDPTAEAAHRQMMRAHHQVGRSHFVTAQYRACVAALSTELAQEPSPATTDLFERLTREGRTTSPR